MSKLQDLIDRLCPNGVPFKPLGTLGVFENIGVDKKTVQGQPLVKLLNYVDVYKNKYIDRNVPQMTVSAPAKKIEACSVRKWDIFITPTSETRDDIGHSSVSVEDIDGAVYSYHIMRFRLNAPNRTTACYINYLFESKEVQKQIFKFASGQTRFGLSKYKFAEILIPIPPLEVQQEIVRILDRFADYPAELQAELQARKAQYEYYRNQLLSFSPEQVTGVEITPPFADLIQWKTMGEICEIRGRIGFRGYTRKDIVSKNQGAISLSPSNIIGGTISYENSTYISWEKYEESPEIKIAKGDVIFTKTASVGKCAIIKNLPCEATINPQLVVLKNITINPDYLNFVLQDSRFQNEVRKYTGIGSVPNISQTTLASIKIPIPPMEVQQRIVDILDRFEALVNDLTAGLPAEIDAVKAQYEYYRNKLLSFRQLSA